LTVSVEKDDHCLLKIYSSSLSSHGVFKVAYAATPPRRTTIVRAGNRVSLFSCDEEKFSLW